ncbi:MAG: hypothetical protein LBM77_13035 [Spirochaetaceae bacterium]|jgi:hypothetical protein|nr:hypothetical protein [Spirochaetaceae bacterium]
MVVSKDAIKALVELSETYDEADGFLSREFTTTQDKYDFIQREFGTTVVARCGNNNADRLTTDYISVLSTIVNRKWRI